MLRVYWLVKLPVGETLVFRRGRKPRRMVLAPVVRFSVRGLLKVTAELLSAQVAAIDRPARVVAETPGLPLTALCLGTSVAVAWVPRVQFSVTLASCCEVAKSFEFKVPNGKFNVLLDPMVQAGLMTRKLMVSV